LPKVCLIFSVVAMLERAEHVAGTDAGIGASGEGGLLELGGGEADEGFEGVENAHAGISSGKTACCSRLAAISQ
jgi:hypothetical protein